MFLFSASCLLGSRASHVFYASRHYPTPTWSHGCLKASSVVKRAFGSTTNNFLTRSRAKATIGQITVKRINILNHNSMPELTGHHPERAERVWDHHSQQTGPPNLPHSLYSEYYEKTRNDNDTPCLLLLGCQSPPLSLPVPSLVACWLKVKLIKAKLPPNSKILGIRSKLSLTSTDGWVRVT